MRSRYSWFTQVLVNLVGPENCHAIRSPGSSFNRSSTICPINGWLGIAPTAPLDSNPGLRSSDSHEHQTSGSSIQSGMALEGSESASNAIPPCSYRISHLMQSATPQSSVFQKCFMCLASRQPLDRSELPQRLTSKSGLRFFHFWMVWSGALVSSPTQTKCRILGITKKSPCNRGKRRRRSQFIPLQFDLSSADSGVG